jgi:hypothetical protein
MSAPLSMPNSPELDRDLALPRGASAPVTRAGWRALARRPLVLLLLATLCINVVALDWGLPNGPDSWAADAFKPLTAVSLVKRAWLDERPNSGWFYFKYPLGHALVLASVQAPYLAWLVAKRDFRAPSSSYPFGFRHPERALETLELIARSVSALMGVGLVALAYVIAALLWSHGAGLAAALLVMGSYPVVFYAHTANVDLPMLFWIALAVAAALASADRGSARLAALAGVAAGMALFTKEQSIGALLACPLVWLLGLRSRRPFPWGAAARFVATAGGAFLVVTVVVGNVWWNPAGFVNRWRFLLGTLPPEIREKYAPYQFLIRSSGLSAFDYEVQHLSATAAEIVNALGVTGVIFVVIGLLWGLSRRTRLTAIPLVVALVYYLVSQRAIELTMVRYSMPALFFLLLVAGAGVSLLAGWIARARPAALRAAGAVLLAASVGWTLLPGLEVDRLMLDDARYAAEDWLRSHAPSAARVEVYQSETYLPRFEKRLEIDFVPLEQRSVGSLRERRPEFIVLSTAGQAGLAARWATDWEPGQSALIESSKAQTLMRALRDGGAGYRTVAHFQSEPRFVVPRINSLNPQITILAREDLAVAKGR